MAGLNILHPCFLAGRPFYGGFGEMALGVSFFPGRLVSLECIPWGLLDCTYRAGRLVPGYSGSPTHLLLTFIAVGEPD